ncbi:sulfite exporter TauE/SafE family protein [Burkholderia sp. 22PA0099]|uniref:sulfite exporter TauE/SafE family protein n=1 Tax=Burkholderia sp. 22PA0099 TaxID=3237372 RepID=UPI0039C323D6
MLTGLICGAVVGIILGMTGAGGGVLAMPFLVLGLGIANRDATPISLIAVALAAAVGTVAALRQRTVRYRAAAVMATAGALFAPLGLRAAHVLPTHVLVIGFCVIMLIVAVRMLLPVFAKQQAQAAARRCPCHVDPATGRFRWTLACTLSLAGTGAFAGLLTGMLGVGGGFVIVPALRQFTDVDMRVAASTSLMVVALVSSITAAGALVGGVHLPENGGIFIAATVGGLVVGRNVAGRVPWQWTQVTFSILVVAVAVWWLARDLL